MVPAMAGAAVVDSAGEEAAGDRVEAWAARTASGVASEIACRDKILLKNQNKIL
jgi:hypothetical protein